MNKENLLEVFCKALAITIIVGIIICISAWIWDKNIINVSFIKDVYSILIGILAPFIAIYLYSNWQEQKQYDLEKEYSQKIITSLDYLFTELVCLRSNVHLIKSTKDLFSYYPNKTKIRNIDFDEKLYSLYGDIDTYTIILKNPNSEIFKNNYHKLERLYTHSISMYFQLREKYYKEYIDIIESQNLNSYNFEYNQSYNESNNSIELSYKKISIESYLSMKGKIKNIGKKEFDFEMTLEDFIKESFKTIEYMKNFCIIMINLRNKG